MAMEEKSYRRLIIPAIEEKFVKMVRKNGCLSEGKMGVKVTMKSGPGNMISIIPMAWSLSKKQRLKLFHTEKMDNPEQLRPVLDACGSSRRGKLPPRLLWSGRSPISW